MFRCMRVLGLAAFIALSISSQAAGFDCQKATTFVEKVICQNPSLSSLDEELNSVFNAIKDNSRNPQTLKKQQLVWLKTKRDLCQTVTCLDDVYKERIIALSSITNVSDSTKSTLAGEYVRYHEKDKPDNRSAFLTISTPEKGKIKVVGTALWVGDIKAGNVHNGEVSGTFVLKDGLVHYQDEAGCKFIILFGKNALKVNGDNGQCGGLNVSFDGYYKKEK